MKEGLLQELSSAQEFFERSSSCLAEEDSGFRPVDGTHCVAHQVAHVAQSIDWFMDGVGSPQGFDLNFEKHWTEIEPCTSLTEARAWVKRSFDRAREVIASMSEQELMSPLPEGPVMGGAPRLAVVGAITDHTAHHRGALTVYARLLGKEPTMPYSDDF